MIGEKLFGSTAESEYNNEQTIATDATQPITVGRRSKRPDGQVSFLSIADRLSGGRIILILSF